ncbi:MAG: 3-deoxy-D-manno-octulosonic acid transferase, partial [Pseudomonadota bacterium]
MSLALQAYLATTALAHPVARLMIRRRLARGKEHGRRWPERLGEPSLPRPEGTLIWLHGASVGEAMSALPLIEAFRGTACLLTTGTVASAARLAPLLPEHACHQFAPVDSRKAVTRFLAHWRPDLAIWIESVFWPCLMTRTARAGIPMALVNARISEASARGWARVPGMARRMLCGFGMIRAQDGETVARLVALGAEPARIREVGNLKALVPVPWSDQARLEAMQAALAGRAVWLAASTHPGEDEIVLEAHAALPGDALLILAPRHPERGARLAEMLAARGLPAARISAGEVPDAQTRVILADTLGEMGLWYRLAPVSFVGGSLTDRGGHTPFEPALLGSAILHGPHTANFAPAYSLLAELGGAVAIEDARALREAVASLLADPAGRQALTEQARALS